MEYVHRTKMGASVVIVPLMLKDFTNEERGGKQEKAPDWTA
jgi:hypothetical protein